MEAEAELCKRDEKKNWSYGTPTES